MAHWRDHTWHVVKADDRSPNELPYLDKPKEASLPPPRTARIEEGSWKAPGLPRYVCYKASAITQLTSTPSRTAQAALSGSSGEEHWEDLFVLDISLQTPQRAIRKGNRPRQTSLIVEEVSSELNWKLAASFYLEHANCNSLKADQIWQISQGATQTIPAPNFKFLFQIMLILKPSQRRHIRNFLTWANNVLGFFSAILLLEMTKALRLKCTIKKQKSALDNAQDTSFEPKCWKFGKAP